ncbi:MAG: hypothetical protein ACI8PQ_002245, partial [Planctomycetota bacterium]
MAGALTLRNACDRFRVQVIVKCCVGALDTESHTTRTSTGNPTSLFPPRYSHLNMQTLSSQLLNSPVTGRNLAGATLGDQLAGAPTLVVFLR